MKRRVSLLIGGLILSAIGLARATSLIDLDANHNNRFDIFDFSHALSRLNQDRTLADLVSIKQHFDAPLPTATPAPSISPTINISPTLPPPTISPSTTPTNPPGASKPNILFILTDDQPYASLAKMPFLSSVSGWFNFSKAYVSNSICCPSRSTILSGKYSHHNGVETNGDGHLLDTSKTMAVWLNNAGYETALVGKYLNYYPFAGQPAIPPGWDKWYVFSPEEDLHKFYYNYQLNENGTLRTYGSTANDYSTDVLKRKAISFIRDVPNNQPFFLMWTPHSPHNAQPHDNLASDKYIFPAAPRHANQNFTVTVPPNFNETDVSDKPKWVRDLASLGGAKQNEIKGHMADQYRMLLAVDEAIQEFMAVLDETGKRNNTIIIFMSDNGYAHGSHRWENKNCPYEECVHVPLLIYHPTYQGRVIDNLVGNLDVPATIADIAGANSNPIDGQSFLPLLTNQGTYNRQSVLLHMKGGLNSKGQVYPGQLYRQNWGLRKDNWKYVEYIANNDVELYDLSTDPYELNNLAKQKSMQSIISQLAAEVDALNN